MEVGDGRNGVWSGVGRWPEQRSEAEESEGWGKKEQNMCASEKEGSYI